MDLLRASDADVYPGSEFFHPGSRFRIQGQKIPGPGSASKNLSVFSPKKFSWMFFPDSGLFPSRSQGSKKHRGPGPDPQHCFGKYLSLILQLLDPQYNSGEDKKLFYHLKSFLFISGYPFPVDGPERERHLPGDCEEAAQGRGCGTGRLRQQCPRKLSRNFREIFIISLKILETNFVCNF